MSFRQDLVTTSIMKVSERLGELYRDTQGWLLTHSNLILIQDSHILDSVVLEICILKAHIFHF